MSSCLPTELLTPCQLLNAERPVGDFCLLVRGTGGLAWRTPSPTPDHWGRTADGLEAASVTSSPGFEESCFVVKPPQYPGQGLENFWSVGMWGCWLVEWGFCNKWTIPGIKGFSELCEPLSSSRLT